VQFSNLVCTDIQQPNAILGLSADPGGLLLYKDGRVVGGLGVEGDSRYGIDLDPADADQPAEERAASAGQRGFEPPELIRGEHIFTDGIALPYNNSSSNAVGAALAPGGFTQAPRAGLPATRMRATLGGVQELGRVSQRFAQLSRRELATVLVVQEDAQQL
jgi:hypothetical protein